MSSDPIGVIVCKQSMHKDLTNRGYIAMLSVDKGWRKRGIGSSPPRPSFHPSQNILDYGETTSGADSLFPPLFPFS